jgi:hypothetical protein
VKAATIGIRTLEDYFVWLKDRQQWHEASSGLVWWVAAGDAGDARQVAAARTTGSR